MKNLILLTLLSLSILSCKKDDDDANSPSVPTCQTLNTCKINFISNSSNPYNVYVNNVFKFQLAGNTSKEIEVTSLTPTLKAVQVSGYILLPTIKEEQVLVESCKSYFWTLP